MRTTTQHTVTTTTPGGRYLMTCTCGWTSGPHMSWAHGEIGANHLRWHAGADAAAVKPTDRATIQRRWEILQRAALQNVPGAPSARSCVCDARDAMEAAVMALPYPGHADADANTRSDLWAAAAARWVDRGASHLWGFNLPEGW